MDGSIVNSSGDASGKYASGAIGVYDLVNTPTNTGGDTATGWYATVTEGGGGLFSGEGGSALNYTNTGATDPRKNVILTDAELGALPPPPDPYTFDTGATSNQLLTDYVLSGGDICVAVKAGETPIPVPCDWDDTDIEAAGFSGSPLLCGSR